MRYDRPIVFRKETPGEYDPTTGNYPEPTVQDVTVYGDVMATSSQTVQLVYGGLKEGAVTIHLQNHYTDPFDWILVDGRKYRADRRVRLRVKDAFICSEVL